MIFCSVILILYGALYQDQKAYWLGMGMFIYMIMVCVLEVRDFIEKLKFNE